MRFLILIFICLNLLACGRANETSPKVAPAANPAGGDNGEAQKPVGTDETNVTDYSVCGDVVPKDMTVTNRSWHYRTATKLASFEMVMYVANGNVTMIQRCATKENKLSAQILVPVSVSADKIQFLAAAEKIETAENGKMECSAAVVVGSWNYSFKGNCLELFGSDATKKTVMVPF